MNIGDFTSPIASDETIREFARIDLTNRVQITDAESLFSIATGKTGEPPLKHSQGGAARPHAGTPPGNAISGKPTNTIASIQKRIVGAYSTSSIIQNTNLRNGFLEILSLCYEWSIWLSRITLNNSPVDLVTTATVLAGFNLYLAWIEHFNFLASTGRLAILNFCKES